MIDRNFVLWIYTALFILTAATTPAWAIKPRPPLQLSLQQTDLSGGQSRLTMIAVANVDVRHVALSLELPPGLSLVDGEEGWEGTLGKGQTQKMEWTIQNPNQIPQKVTGKAVVELNGGEKFVEQATLTLHEAKSDTPLRAPSIKHKEGGETILEFKGK